MEFLKNTILLMLLASSLVLSGTLAASSVESVTVDGNLVSLLVPDSYDPNEPLPVIVLLHGFTANSSYVNILFGLGAHVDTYGFIYAFPRGALDPNGERYWNATDACCDFFDGGNDHVGYLSTLVDAIAADWSVDSRRVYFMGHSNGGFMSFRMACDRADMVTAIVSLSGGTFKNKNDCTPSQPVHVLQIHGTADETVLYDGGEFNGVPYPSAGETIENWAGYLGCSGQPSPGQDYDLVSTLAGKETSVSLYDTGCVEGGSAELWTMNGALHTPVLSNDFAPTILNWALGKSKPESDDPPSLAFNPGFSDIWRNAVKKGGQGVFVVVLPELKSIFIAWFTYDLDDPPDDIDFTIGHPSQRWYTAFGPYDGDTAVLELELNSNGIFDSATQHTRVADGTVTLKANGCGELIMAYDITKANVAEEIVLSRATPGLVALCESLASGEEAKVLRQTPAARQSPDHAMPAIAGENSFNATFNDAWRNPEKKGGQGVLPMVLPDIGSIFLGWFTYDLEVPADGIEHTIGHPSQRWYTAFGPYDGDTAVLDLELNSNGIFDSATNQTQVTDGTVTLKANGCDSITMSYEIHSADIAGDIPLARAVGDNVARCQDAMEEP